MNKILIVEDDLELNKTLKIFLENNSFNVTSAYDGIEGFNSFINEKYDIIISDIMMPNCDGFKFLKEVRNIDKEIPFIFLSAKEDLNSKTIGYNEGIDDYIVKPIAFKELLLKINAILKRSKLNTNKRIIISNCKMDLEERICYIDDKEIDLTVKEFNILYKFLSYPKKTFSRSAIMDEFWGYDTFTTARSVDVSIAKIREKTKKAKGFEIVTVHGLGYRLKINEEI